MDGILVIDKPKGLTSHDVVDFIRRKFGFKTVGHAGTLDPMATGVLVILLGSSTKSSQTFSSDDKVYEGTIFLGATSDTGDACGKIEQTAKSVHFTAKEIEDVFNKFLGEIEQHPPMYSAVKHKGRKLYEFARKGISVETRPRKVMIKELSIVNIALPEVQFKVTCSKGTYVRQLAIDIGKALGCGAHLSALKRTRSGRFSIDEAMSMEELKAMSVLELEKKVIGLN